MPEILSSSKEKVLLHGDLHYDNIISDGDSWVVIDPHGVIGFPINEVWTFIEDLEKDVSIISKNFHISNDIILKAYYVHSCLAACWAVEDNMNPKKFLELADKAVGKI